MAVVSNVAPSYAPRGSTLIQATVVGNPEMTEFDLEAKSRGQLTRWFGPQVGEWRLLRTYRITKALPDQIPPTPDHLNQPVRENPWLFVCAEYQSLSSIHWAMFSGRRAAEAVIWDLHYGETMTFDLDRARLFQPGAGHKAQAIRCIALTEKNAYLK